MIDELTSPDRKIREEAVLKLISMNISLVEKQQHLHKALTDEHESVRISAAKVIKDIKADSFTEISKLLPEEKFWGVRFEFLKTLNALDKKQAQPILIEATKDIKPNVRILAMELLEQNDQVIQKIIDLTKDKDSRVQAKAIKLLDKVQSPAAKAFMDDYNKRLNKKLSKGEKMKEMFGDDVKGFDGSF